MRLVDVVLRQGHLSEQAIAGAVMTGDRPPHLDRCDLCADRALEMSRWLDDVRDTASDAADEAFPPERLAAQQAQILRRLEQADEPPRVIAFPAHTPADRADRGTRRVAPAWVGVAAAAGLIVGVISGQMSARLGHDVTAAPQTPPMSVTTPAPAVAADVPTSNASFLDLDLDASAPEPLTTLNEITPRMLNVVAMVQPAAH
jgi:hypothetical protein